MMPNTYQQTLGLHQHAQIPGAVSIGLGLINDNSIEQTLATNGLNQRALQILQALPEKLAELLSTLDHLLLLHNLQSTDGDGTAQWVTAIGRTVGTRLDREHDVLAAEHTRDGVHTTRNGLAQEDQVGLDSAPLVTQQLTRAGNTSLDLVTDQEYIVLVAQSASLLQVILVGNDDTGLALNGLNQEGGQVRAGRLKGLTQSSLVIVGDGLLGAGDCAPDTGEVGPVVLTGLRVRGQRDRGELMQGAVMVSHRVHRGLEQGCRDEPRDKIKELTYSTTVEVVLSAQDNRLVLRDTLHLVSPLPSDLDTRLDRLGTRVHGQDHVEAEVAGDELRKAGEDVIVECARAQGHPRRLVHQCGHQLGVAVTLIHGRVRREKVEIVTSLGVPDGSTLSAGKDHGQRVIVVSRIVVLGLNGLLTRGSVVAGNRTVGPVGSHGGNWELGIAGELESWRKVKV
jgi:hypothetical protein